MSTSVPTIEQITELRKAIRTDERMKRKHEKHRQRLADLRKLEKDLLNKIAKSQSKLAEAQDEIIKGLERTFDYSDDLTLSAAKETLAKLEATYAT